jgi:hypothetical protein
MVLMIMGYTYGQTANEFLILVENISVAKGFIDSRAM